MLWGLSDGALAALAGLAGGIVLGLAARLGRFCTLGAIEDMLYGDDDRRMRMWALAIAVAIAGSFALIGSDRLDPSATLYGILAWSPMASIVGGLMFGYGMALAGNCGYGALARLGGGDLRALMIVLVMGVAAYMAVAGPTAVLRVWIFPPMAAEGDRFSGIAHWLGGKTGLSPGTFAYLIAAGLAVLALSKQSFRGSISMCMWAIAVGLAIVSGWAATSFVATNGFDGISIASHTFSAPVGETLLYIMTSSGGGLSFGIGSVCGVILGAFVGCLIRGHFRWEACEDPGELRRQLLGAFLMGTGAVTALGCSVGQGLSAFSLLCFSAPVVFVSILAGAAIGLRQLIHGWSPAE